VSSGEFEKKASALALADLGGNEAEAPKMRKRKSALWLYYTFFDRPCQVMSARREGFVCWADCFVATDRLLTFRRGDNIDGKMPQSISAGMGKTCTRTPSVFPPIGGGQRLVLLRLKEFLASFADKPIMITDAAGKQGPMTGLFAAISYDDGNTWLRIRSITDDGPERQMQTTNGKRFTMSISRAEPRGYLSVCQGANGLIHLTSTWNHCAFNLKWLQSPPPDTFSP
jgi:hypothetical protein